MSRQEGIQRYQFIIHRLSTRPSSFKEIQDYLKIQAELTEDNLNCSIRTFQRDIKDIERLYDIVIKYDRSMKVYRIIHDGREKHSERLMETFDLYNAIKVSNNFGNHLLFENRRALGTEYMHGLLHAIKSRKEISFSYTSYYNDSVSKRTVQPLAIKEARQRWYLLGKDTRDEVIKSFGLDRISDLEISNRSFDELKEYDPEKDYRYSFGIINGTDEKPEKIELSFSPKEGRFVKSLPLHHSQTLVAETEKETIFKYHLIPTYDFRMEILSFGNQVQVLKPKSLRTKIIQQLKESLEVYKK
ncbi:helix-turn-helix transcriptional regulator [Christiangramia sabulilitoris]|uniref:WYL domain-containing protein n=1 Tax=Christiangramia sabulilitoris TaxID=2583991 RepID=A0A550I823_9FLAO|nr:WYL domain-containing protein [Christiangramia sabulilitoris]TRO66968.1 WYL domain-containing protein [Christiangramia sabulilitoris]